MATRQAFYDHYHRQNDRFNKLIGVNNFTYFYIFELLHQACLPQQYQGLDILDVGCGVGTLSLWLAHKGAKVQGLDVSPRAIGIATNAAQSLDLDNVTFRVGELHSGKGKYDLVLCSEVIEHVLDDQKLLDLIWTQLKPGGQLVLTTPSRELWLYHLGYYRHFDQAVGHVRRYTVAQIVKLVTEAGFEVEYQRAVEGPLRNILFTSPLGILIKGIRGPLVPLFHWFDRLSAKVAGAADIQIIARKPIGRQKK